MESKLLKSYFKISGLERGKKKIFCVLSNRKKERSIIFEKGNKNAIKFMKNKLDSPIKKIVYLLIKINILPLFLRKIKLDPSVGQLVFFGGQTKIFNFNKKIVISFLREPGWEKDFIKNKKDQERFAKDGFALQILKMNKKIPFSIEEFVEEGSRINSVEIFRKLFRFYKSQKVKKISYNLYIKKLEKKDSFTKLPKEVSEELEKMKNKQNQFFYIVKIHGDFGREQVLLKKGKIIFTDWKLIEGLILTDLFNFFLKEKDIFKNKKFLHILQMFPEEVKKNAKDYFIVSLVNLFLSNIISSNLMMDWLKPFLLKKD